MDFGMLIPNMYAILFHHVRFKSCCLIKYMASTLLCINSMLLPTGPKLPIINISAAKLATKISHGLHMYTVLFLHQDWRNGGIRSVHKFHLDYQWCGEGPRSNEHMREVCYEHRSDEWRWFIDSSKRSLIEELLNNYKERPRCLWLMLSTWERSTK